MPVEIDFMESDSFLVHLGMRLIDYVCLICSRSKTFQDRLDSETIIPSKAGCDKLLSFLERDAVRNEITKYEAAFFCDESIKCLREIYDLREKAGTRMNNDCSLLLSQADEAYFADKVLSYVSSYDKYLELQNRGYEQDRMYFKGIGFGDVGLYQDPKTSLDNIMVTLLRKIHSRKASSKRSQKASEKREKDEPAFRKKVIDAANEIKSLIEKEGEKPLGLDAMASEVSQNLGHKGGLQRKIKEILRKENYPAKRTGRKKPE